MTEWLNVRHCEFSFLYGKHMNFQIQLTKNVNSLPITRDYIQQIELKHT